ncbi:hypothetical protein [Xenophilus azovorans]|uniref:hypothetical protein n=1 Tax=Xenophilus azovorans TaxID=151755 RepID=UPI0012ED6944|nr:hypothetical protein [Xenophilus azovorans]
MRPEGAWIKASAVLHAKRAKMENPLKSTTCARYRFGSGGILRSGIFARRSSTGVHKSAAPHVFSLDKSRRRKTEFTNYHNQRPACAARSARE